MSDYNSSSPKGDWSECPRCKLCTTRRKVVLRRSGLIQLGAICHIEIDTVPFDADQRLLTFQGYQKLDREGKLHWLHPHLEFFALRKLSDSIPHILIIGEGPGAHEDNTGLPFWGPAGQILDNVIHQTRSTFFFTMTNTVCCRPTKHSINEFTQQVYVSNRPPTPEEQEACKPHIEELCDSYDFAGILTLGDVADKNRANNFYQYPYLHLRHPSWILRQDYRLRHCIKQGLEIDEWIRKLTEITPSL